MNSIALTYPSTRKLSRLSRAAGFWASRSRFLVLGAFATAPERPLRALRQQEGLSGLTLTIVYAVYAAGLVLSLVLAGHSPTPTAACPADPRTRRRGLAAVVFIVWQSLPGLLVARVLTGLALGVSVPPPPRTSPISTPGRTGRRRGARASSPRSPTSAAWRSAR
jgi:MFS family permease